MIAQGGKAGLKMSESDTRLTSKLFHGEYMGSTCTFRSHGGSAAELEAFIVFIVVFCRQWEQEQALHSHYNARLADGLRSHAAVNAIRTHSPRPAVRSQKKINHSSICEGEATVGHSCPSIKPLASCPMEAKVTAMTQPPGRLAFR
ncbi:hypothetical protein EYF80_019282 [Liparis tanakae]|uniref:Uncharacterized protein n=1 Tax=Liparis tanakae TaxID=230148 RepID=A0A4Z2HXX3_9TELE|nr:hypothetical protein EYF80_019282 [Liparis tanakae]